MPARSRRQRPSGCQIHWKPFETVKLSNSTSRNNKRQPIKRRRNTAIYLKRKSEAENCGDAKRIPQASRNQTFPKTMATVPSLSQDPSEVACGVRTPEHSERPMKLLRVFTEQRYHLWETATAEGDYLLIPTRGLSGPVASGGRLIATHVTASTFAFWEWWWPRATRLGNDPGGTFSEQSHFFCANSQRRNKDSAGPSPEAQRASGVVTHALCFCRSLYMYVIGV